MPKRGDTQHKQEVDRIRCKQMLEDGKRPCDIMKKLKRSKKFIFESRNNRKTIYKCQTKNVQVHQKNLM